MAYFQLQRIYQYVAFNTNFITGLNSSWGMLVFIHVLYILNSLYRIKSYQLSLPLCRMKPHSSQFTWQQFYNLYMSLQWHRLSVDRILIVLNGRSYSYTVYSTLLNSHKFWELGVHHNCIPCHIMTNTLNFAQSFEKKFFVTVSSVESSFWSVTMFFAWFVFV